MNALKILLFSIVFFFCWTATLAIASETKGAWELYVVPEKYTINLGEELRLRFGLTGYGNIDPIKLKIVAYSEEATIIKYKDSISSKIYNTFTIFPEINDPNTSVRFTKKQTTAPDYSIALVTDYASLFDWLKLIPQSPGNKKLTLIATYYVQDEGWHTSKYDFDYHVNTWAEQHQTGITIGSIIIGLFSISFLPSVGMRICSMLRKDQINVDCPKTTKRKK